MCNYLLRPLIQRFKKEDMTAFPQIYEVFENLIGMYALRLGYEDGKSELNLFFIELLYSIDLSRFPADESIGINRYVAVALRNKYISLSMKESKRRKHLLPLLQNCDGFYYDIDQKILLDLALETLTDKQKEVILKKYYYGYSIAEISGRCGVSRQSVNDVKKRAICCLEKNLLG